MRKMFAIFLVVALLCGCTAGESAPEEPAAAQVGLCLKGDLGSAAYQQSLSDSLAAQNWQVSVVDAGQDQSLQDQQILDFIEQGASLLIIEPVMTDTVSEIVEQLKQSGTPAIFIGRQPPMAAMSSWHSVCYVGGGENPAPAQIQLVLQSESHGDLNGDGIVSYGVLAGDEILQSTQAALQSYETGLPGSEPLAIAYTTLTQDAGKLQCYEMLLQYGPDLEVLFCHSDALALGAAEALRAEGRIVGTDLLLIGSGGSREAMEQIRDAQITGTVMLSAQAIAEIVTNVAQLLLQGNPVEPHYPVEWSCVDKKAVAVILK